MSKPRSWIANVADVCNSELAGGCAIALVILAILLGMGGCIYMERSGQATVEKAQKGQK